jgi:hypothetical protein
MPSRIEGRRDERGNVIGVFIVNDLAERPLAMPCDDRGRPDSDGFEWGYSGTGPTALAIALLAHVHDIGACPGQSTASALPPQCRVSGAKRSISIVELRDHAIARIPRDVTWWSCEVAALRAFARRENDALLFALSDGRTVA